MKICILTPRFPFPENGGDVLRINNIARYLKSKGHNLILVSYDSKRADFYECSKLYDKLFCIKRNKLVSLFNSVLFLFLHKPIQCGYYYSRQYLRLLKKVIRQESPDLFISHLLRMVPYLEKLDLNKKSIIEMTDALSKTYSLSTTSNTKSWKKHIYRIEKRLIQQYEKRAIDNFSKVVLVSENDIRYLNELSNSISNNIVCYTNGVKCFDKISSNYSKKISFVGNMRTLQNQDAVIHFINDILPLIKEKFPEIIFEIVGAEPPENIIKFASKTIKVTGFVDSVEDVIKDSCLVVAPVQIAAGIQNKVLIAMACRIPVVLTSLISKAIPELRDMENCLIKDSSRDFADACVKLIEEDTFRNKIAENGYKLVQENYSWNAKLEGYEII